MSDDRLDEQRDADDIRSLLPLYVAGSLTPEQMRAVASRLKADPELQTDLQFWLSIAQVERQRESADGQGHTTPELLAGFADEPGGLQDNERQEIESHLSSCPTCRDDLRMLREAIGEVVPPRSAVPMWRYAAAAVIVLALVGTLLTLSPHLQMPSSETSLEQAPQSAANSKMATLQIPYRETFRGADGLKDAPAVFMIGGEADSVLLIVEVPVIPAHAGELRWTLGDTARVWGEVGSQSFSDSQAVPHPVPKPEVATLSEYLIVRDESGYSRIQFRIPAGLLQRNRQTVLRGVSDTHGEFLYRFIVVR
jgi:hypothetical protein